MKNIFTKLFAAAALLTLTMGVKATDIPLTVGTYLTTSESATTGTINNNDGGNLGSIQKTATATFTLSNASEQEMVLYFLTGNNNNSDPTVTITLNNGSSDFFTQTIDIRNTGAWAPVTIHAIEVGSVPTGTISLKFEFNNTSSYVCNLGSIGLYNKAAYLATVDATPGDVTLAKGSYQTARVENGGNVGYCSNGARATYLVNNNVAGVFDLNIGLVHYGDGTLTVNVRDAATDALEITKPITINNSVCKGYDNPTSFELGKLTAGLKTVEFVMATEASYLCNYKNVSLSASWKDIAIDLRSGQLGTSGNNLQKYLTINNSGLYTYSDAASANDNAILNAASYNGADHGYVSAKATVPVKAGIYKITLGTCQFGTGTAYVKNSDESNTLSIVDALGQAATSFNQNNGTCYHSNTTANVVDAWYVAESDETIKIVCGNYTPYIAIERVNALPPLRYSLTYVNAEGATGTVPASRILTPGESEALSANNRALYKDGYTLTGWHDGTTTHALGTTITPEANTTLTAVYTANPYTLAQSLEELTVRWDFQRQNGCPEVQWQNRTGDFLITQATINGVSTDVKIDINTNPGKFANASWTDWCQVNEGTTFTFPTIDGSTVKAYSLNEPKNNSNEKNTVDGNEYSSFASNIATYEVDPTDGISTMSIKGGSYYRYIDVTYPASAAAMPLKTLVIDSIAAGNDALAAINNASLSYTATISGNIYTTEPVVKATFSDDATATAVVSGSGTTRTYTFNQTISGTQYTFVLHIEGINIYTPGEHAERFDIKYNGGTLTGDNPKVWTSNTNSAYTMTTTALDGYQADFKLNANTDEPYTISIPEDVIVKQFILKNFHANFKNGNGQLKTVTSEGATTILPTRRNCVCNAINSQRDDQAYEGEAYDLVVNIENHVAGTPIVFTMVKSAQPMGWIQLVTDRVYERTYTHMNLNTLCFPYSVYEYSGATFYNILSTEVDGGDLTKLVLEEHVGALEAGVPYFYDPTQGEDKLVCYYNGERENTPLTAANGAFVGTYADNSAVPEGSYVTVNNELYKCGTGVTMGAYRAYIDPTVGSYVRAAVPGRRRLVLGGNKVPTEVEAISNQQSAISHKVIRDGQLFIIRDGKTYNAQGQPIGR